VKNKYEIIIYWNDADNVFVAEMPELYGCVAHGDTYQEALEQVNAVANEWLKLAQENGWHTPKPKGRLMFA
jgi:predicted RNase H-like HicB family nuclease